MVGGMIVTVGFMTKNTHTHTWHHTGIFFVEEDAGKCSGVPRMCVEGIIESVLISSLEKARERFCREMTNSA